MLSVLDSFQLGGLELQSRFIRSATQERIAPDTPDAGRRLGAMYAALARGGVGLIVTGHLAVSPNGRGGPFMGQLWNTDHEDVLRAAAEMTHEAGCVLFAQLNHVGGRRKPEMGGDGVCVSPLPGRGRDAMQGRPLDSRGIDELIAAYGAAAARAKEAGMDGVQIHAAHGYLGTQFLSPATNCRDDEWGGSLENRARFLRGVVRTVRQLVGPRFPVGMKLGASDDDPAGLTLDDSVQAARWFVEDGLDFIEISGGFRSDVIKRKVKPGVDEAYYLPLARAFKRALSIPVVAVGGFRSLDVMDCALNGSHCDAIALSRPLICQPDLPNVLRAGGRCECVSCNLCLLKHDGPISCYGPARRQSAAPG